MKTLILALAALAGLPLLAAAEAPAPAKTLGVASQIQHRFIGIDEPRAQLVYVDQAVPTSNWTLKLPEKCRDYQLVGDNKLLLSGGDGYYEYDLKTRQQTKAVKGYPGGVFARRRADGSTLLGRNVGDHVEISILDAADRLQKTLTFPKAGTRLGRLTSEGTVLFGNNTQLLEGSLDGQPAKAIPVSDCKHLYQAVRRPDGHIVLASGYTAAIVELDVQGQEVRRLGGLNHPQAKGLGFHFFSGFQTLKNGHVVVANWTGHGASDSANGVQLVEFAPDGSIAWTWHDPAMAGSLHGVLVLDDLDLQSLNADAPGGHRFACTDYSGQKVFVVGTDGRVEWEMATDGNGNDLWALANGNLLFTTGHGVKEVTPEKKTVFEYVSKSEIYACQRLANGNTFVGECNAGRLLEVAPDGKIAKEVRLLPAGKDGGHAYYRNARQLADGHYLVAHYGDQAVREYAADGQLVREIPAPGGPHTAVRLANGNTLISCGDMKSETGPRIFEVDPAGKTVWEVKNGDLPGIKLAFITGFQRLPNGNTLMSNWLGHGKFGTAPQLIEVTPEKQVVWTFDDPRTMKTISSVQVLDLPAEAPIFH